MREFEGSSQFKPPWFRKIHGNIDTTVFLFCIYQKNCNGRGSLPKKPAQIKQACSFEALALLQGNFSQLGMKWKECLAGNMILWMGMGEPEGKPLSTWRVWTHILLPLTKSFDLYSARKAAATWLQQRCLSVRSTPTSRRGTIRAMFQRGRIKIRINAYSRGGWRTHNTIHAHNWTH